MATTLTAGDVELVQGKTEGDRDFGYVFGQDGATSAKASRSVLSGYGTVAEAAEAAGVPRTTLLYAVERGELLTIDTFGGTTLVDVMSAKKWARKRPRPGRKTQR